MSTQKFIGDVLLRGGVVDAAGLVLGLEVQSRELTTIGRALAGLGLAGVDFLQKPFTAAQLNRRIREAIDR